jgi:hypothetical protein
MRALILISAAVGVASLLHLVVLRLRPGFPMANEMLLLICITAVILSMYSVTTVRRALFGRAAQGQSVSESRRRAVGTAMAFAAAFSGWLFASSDLMVSIGNMDYTDIHHWFYREVPAAGMFLIDGLVIGLVIVCLTSSPGGDSDQQDANEAAEFRRNGAGPWKRIFGGVVVVLAVAISIWEWLPWFVLHAALWMVLLPLFIVRILSRRPRLRVLHYSFSLGTVAVAMAALVLTLGAGAVLVGMLSVQQGGQVVAEGLHLAVLGPWIALAFYIVGYLPIQARYAMQDVTYRLPIMENIVHLGLLATMALVAPYFLLWIEFRYGG